ncbi:unnamed protein product, partial [Timema podura]|nr:unnamed protein product [Timema podura]
MLQSMYDLFEFDGAWINIQEKCIQEGWFIISKGMMPCLSSTDTALPEHLRFYNSD